MTFPPSPDGRSLRRAHDGYEERDPMTFRKWLRAYRNEPSRRGDTAREVLADRDFPREPLTAERIRDHLHAMNACDAAMNCVLDTFAQYQEMTR